MEIQKKESYTEPVLVVHALLRDITAQKSGGQCQKTADAACAS